MRFYFSNEIKSSFQFLKDMHESAKAEIKKEGGSGIPVGNSDYLVAVFSQYLNVKPSITVYAKTRVLRAAILQMEKIESLEALASKCHSIYKELLKNEKEIEFFTGIVLDGAPPFRRFNFEDLNVEVIGEKGKFGAEIENFWSLIDKDSNQGINKFSACKKMPIVYLRALIKDIDPNFAIHKLSSKFNQILALLNLSILPNQPGSILVGDLNKSIINPVPWPFFLYASFDDGDSGRPYYFWNTDWNMPTKFNNFDGENSVKRNRFKSYRKAISTEQGLKKHVPELLGKYLGAISEQDINLSVNYLWAVLEKGLCVEEGQSHKEIVNRFLRFVKAKDQKFVEAMLNAIRCSRNNRIHGLVDPHGSVSQTHFEYLHSFVRFVLDQYLFNRLDFADIEEFTAFLKSDLDETVLKRRIRALNKAADFRFGN